MTVAARRQREREARRESILDAAEAVVDEHGFAGLTMGAVAKRAELSKGALYLYFENRDALCAAIAVRTLGQFLPRMRRAAEVEATGLEAVLGILRSQALFFEAHRSHLRFAIGWMVSPGDIDDSSESFQRYKGKIGEVLAFVVQNIERGKADGTIRPDIPSLLLAQQLWTSSIGVFIALAQRDQMAKRSPLPFDMQALLELHLAQVTRALTPTPAPVEAE